MSNLVSIEEPQSSGEAYSPFDTMLDINQLIAGSWKEGRPGKLATFLAIAHLVSMRATCARARVGCVITDWDLTSIVSIGYNGGAAKLPNGCDRPEEKGNCGCIHAEVNALVKAPYGQQLILFCTDSPCVQCAKLIVNSSVKLVVYDRQYRVTEGLRVLQDGGVRAHVLSPRAA